MVLKVLAAVVNAVLPSRYYRGAYIITLSPKLVQDPEVEILINVLRSTTKNDQIFADECDLTFASSVRSFCSRFLTAKETRLDAIIFAHEYQQLGSIISPSFLILILLLPVLLVAPTERDIRIINMRVLDALPSDGQIPKTDDSIIRVVSDKVQKSNIVAYPYTIAPLLSTVRGRNQSTFGLYMLLQPFLRLLTKSTTSALQSVLHVLFLPTPFKSNTRQGTDAPEECAVVNPRIPSLVTADTADAQVPDDGELGGVHLGQAVWEGLKGALKEWEKVNSQGEEKAGCDDGPSVDIPNS
ncbi:hypothetical protein BDR05DRAFT_978949 [Suillus weaverae]|nr:hypothetical protein BDR05DRAFT_978949 [Suillus weaverae]